MELNQTELRTATQDTEKDRFLMFSLGDETYGIEIQYVDEIIYMSHITRLPEVPDYLKGIINMRGKVIPVIDVRIKFGKEEIPYNDRTCIIVVELSGMTVGLIVDAVAAVDTVTQDIIVKPPESNQSIQNAYLSGIAAVEGSVKLLLDIRKLILENEQDDALVGAV